jgi:phage shock protein C
MYCTKCGTELRDTDKFCSSCGNATAPAQAPPVEGWSQPNQRLFLDKRNKKIAGVCAGFARYFGVDLVLMRVIWLAVAITTGVGFLVYLAAWIVVPSDHSDI